MNKTNKHILWEERILEWEKSGLSKRKWCQENKVTEHQFYYWMKRINEYNESESSNEFKASWQAVELINRPVDELNSSLIVHVEDFKVEVNHNTDLHLLSNILRMLRTC